MKKSVTAAVLASLAISGAVHAQDGAGSNANGNEKVCVVNSTSSQSEQGITEALKVCKRGDILDIGWLSTVGAMQLCDFTKAVLYHPAKGSVIACVYSGNRRTSAK